jgi:hypothetical protein
VANGNSISNNGVRFRRTRWWSRTSAGCSSPALVEAKFLDPSTKSDRGSESGLPKDRIAATTHIGVSRAWKPIICGGANRSVSGSDHIAMGTTRDGSAYSPTSAVSPSADRGPHSQDSAIQILAVPSCHYFTSGTCGQARHRPQLTRQRALTTAGVRSPCWFPSLAYIQARYFSVASGSMFRALLNGPALTTKNLRAFGLDKRGCGRIPRLLL